MQDCAVVHIAHDYINALGKFFTEYLPESKSSSPNLSSSDFFIEHTKIKSVREHSSFNTRTEIKLSATNFHYL
jgi:hypothetical protein